MTPAKRKPSSGGKNTKDIKTTVIIVLLCVVVAQTFLLWHGKKKPSPQAQQVKPVEVLKPVKVKKVPLAPPMAGLFRHAAPGSAGKIAFILDDWGYTMRNCKYLKDIAEPLTVSVLPNLRNTDNIMKCADANGKDIMLHLPLEPYATGDRYPDNYLITTAMKPSRVIELMDGSLAKMPLAQGINNHMGSKATENKALMRVVLKQIKKKGLFFVDSMTAPNHSICGEVAKELHIPFAVRDVFLDNINTREEIEKQITSLAQKARKKGFAIAIGHDRELTLRVIKEEIPILEDEGFEIVRVKTLLKTQ